VTTDELRQSIEVLVEGNIVDRYHDLVEVEGTTFPVTRYVVDIITDFRNSVDGDVVEVVLPGGPTPRGTWMAASGAPRIRVGQPALITGSFVPGSDRDVNLVDWDRGVLTAEVGASGLTYALNGQGRPISGFSLFSTRGVPSMATCATSGCDSDAPLWEGCFDEEDGMTTDLGPDNGEWPMSLDEEVAAVTWRDAVDTWVSLILEPATSSDGGGR
jgi:hypothetical protein